MVRLRLGVLAVLAVLATAAGCGNPIFSAACDALVEGTHAADAKGGGVRIRHHRACHHPRRMPVVVSGCTDSDAAVIQAYGMCLSNLPTCPPETHATWTEQWDACVFIVAHVSPNCPS